MNTNTNTNSIPNTKLGEIYFPKLVMGIHPFDGVSYKSSEQDRINLKMFGNVTSVSKVIKFAVEKHNFSVVQVDHMNPRLNRMHLQAIWETELSLKKSLGLLAYILIPITLNGK